MGDEKHELSLMLAKPNVFSSLDATSNCEFIFIFRAHIYLYHQSSINF